ncbi:MAG: twin-arginine translocase subunit TatC [Planctomycetaceae bacterium]|nr:MAG: twin-arginine translocase subunit TatC [Planctomycetaceae bacterium]
MDNTTEEKQPVTSHLEELRKRLIYSFIAVGVSFIICFTFKEWLFKILTLPLVATLPENSSMIFTSLPEAFFTYLKVSFFGGLFLASPFVLYQIWKFISPGLYVSEKKYAFPFVFFSTICFLGGSLFAYFVVFPFGFKFFVGFATDFIKPMLTLKEFLSFSCKLLLAFGIIFELPIFMFFMARIGLVNSRTLSAKRKYAILITFIVAAVLTPPDVVTQIIMAIPVMLLYEISIWIVRLAEKKEAKNTV